MVGTAARIRVFGEIVRHSDVSHLGVDQAVQDTAINNCSSADAGADRQIEKIREILRGPPACFPERGSVDISIKTYWHAQGISHRSSQIVILPSGLGCGSYIAKCERRPVQVNRPKRADAHRLQFAFGFLPQKLDGSGEGGIGSRSRELNRAQILRPGAYATDEFCTACLDCAKHIGFKP